MIFVMQSIGEFISNNITSLRRALSSCCKSCDTFRELNLLPDFLLTPWSSPSWEASQIPGNLWKTKIPYCIHKWPPRVPILSQLDPVHTHTFYFLKILLDIILLSLPGSPKLSPSFRFPNQNPVYASPLPHTCNMSHPFHFRKGNMLLLSL